MDERTKYFLASVDAIKQADTRLTDRIIVRMVERPLNYLIDLRHERQIVDDKTYNLWFNKILPELKWRIEQYNQLDDEALLQECKTLWKNHRQKIIDALQLKVATIRNRFIQKKRNDLLTIYDIGHNIPLYPKGQRKLANKPLIVQEIQKHVADLKQYGVFAIHIQKILKKPNIFYNIGELGQDKLTRQRALKLKQLDNQLVEIIKIAENVDANWSTLRNARKQYHIQRDEEQEYFKRIKKESTYLDGSGDKKKAIKNQKGMIICILWMRELNKIN
ncbi:hypothetical protein ACWCL1_08855 [Ligilactobacillus sp. LYQ135]